MRVTQKRKPTNKEFKDNFVALASNEPKVGHLTKQKRTGDDSQTVEGVLKYVLKNAIDSNGWVVEVGTGSDKSLYKCSNPLGVTSLPDSTETDEKYVIKGKIRTEISIDKKNKIYTIKRIINNTSMELFKYANKLYISIDNNKKTNQNVNSTITLTENGIDLNADSVTVTNGSSVINIVETQNKINELEEKITNLEKQLNKEE